MLDSLSAPERDVAESLDPHALLAAIVSTGATHVITVPDTHQKSLLALLEDSPDLCLVTVCTEDEVMGVNLGLFMGGQRPFILIQNSGLYACLNTVRGLSLDARVPACMLIGEFSRNPRQLPGDHASRLVHLLEPTLDTWRIPTVRLDHPGDIPRIAKAMDRAWSERGPVAILVGGTTKELR